MFDQVARPVDPWWSVPGPMPWAEARLRAHRAARPLHPHRLRVGDALGAVLAAPLVAAMPLPDADCAATDGYAVCERDPWRLRWTVGAGRLLSGEAVLTVAGASVPGALSDAVAPMLPGPIAAAGGVVTDAVRAPDGCAGLAAAIDAADAELVLVRGSASAPRTDRLREALAAVGAPPIVDGVWCRPGGSQVLAVLGDGRIVAGLPGDPLAALTALLTLAAPVLAGLQGRPLPDLQRRYASRMPADPAGWTRLVPARLRDSVAEPVGHHGPAMLRGAASAEALAVIDPSAAPAGPQLTTARILPIPA